jgi:putative SOS response-associated peptidase YedK
MCGRFSASKSGEELVEEFSLKVIRAQPPRLYNVAPTRLVPVVINDGAAALDAFRWGLIPGWATHPAVGAQGINARGESLEDKAMFRDAFRLRRCLVLADGFYEWKKSGEGKVPHFIRLAKGGSMAFAGLWERWCSPDGQLVLTCAIVTTAPNSVMAALHDRMPVILGPDGREAWLATAPQPPEALRPLLQPCPSEWLEAYPVSSRVNAADNDGPECVVPSAPQPPRQGSLF